VNKFVWVLASVFLVELNATCPSESHPEASSTAKPTSTIQYHIYEANGRIHLGRETVAIRRTEASWTIETTFVPDREAQQADSGALWNGFLVTTEDWTPVRASWSGSMGDLDAIQLRPPASEPRSLELVTVNKSGTSFALPQVSHTDLFLPVEAPGTRAVICRLAGDSVVVRHLFPGVEATVGPRRPLDITSPNGPLDGVTLIEAAPVAGTKPLEVICSGPNLVLSRQGHSWVVAEGYEAVARRLGAEL